VTEVRHAGAIAYREAGPPDGPAAVLLHGWPYSSFMYAPVVERLGAAGIRAIAPDFPGYGDSPPDPPATWARFAELVEGVRTALDLGPTALVLHDWGVAIGLRWADEHPGDLSALVLTNGGTALVEGRWHPVARDLRSEGEGEAFMRYMGRDLFDARMRQLSRGMTDHARDEYYKCMADMERRQGVLELYRSAEPEDLVRYAGVPARLNVPTLVLWADDDDVVPMSIGRHFHEITPGSRLAVIEGAGHALYDDEPEATSAAITRFLAVQLL
jgi:haloalkane dehalogenase